MDNSVIIVFNFLARSISGGGNCRLAFAARNNFYTAMVNCDSDTSLSSKIILDIVKSEVAICASSVFAMLADGATIFVAPSAHSQIGICEYPI